MPIRMTDDPGSDQEEPRPRPRDNGGSSGGGGGGGGGGSLMALFALIVFFFKHPKLTLVLLVVGAGLYWLGGGTDGASSGGTRTPREDGEFAAGATLDPAEYDKALVYEPLADSGPDAPGEKVSLLEYAPKRLSQGQQGSCVGWASSYAARTILYARQTGKPPDEVAFSPSFLYNQIAVNEQCEGSYIRKALETLQRTGDLPLGEFPYDAEQCTTLPSDEQRERAAQFRISGYTRLSLDSEDYEVNVDAIKQHLAKRAPVIIGMYVGGTFEAAMRGQRVWHPTDEDYEDKKNWGGHAMAVIGYDDTLEGGAFQIMNSWGARWGENGVGWVKYKDFNHFVDEAYGLYPMGEARAKSGTQKVRFGLVQYGSNERIPLRRVRDGLYRTVSPIAKGTRFKVEFSNTRPCYTYLFGQETDGSSYVLFPYTDKHSPYCGTTGTRIFPRKQSLTADEVGERDSVAVVISPKPLEFRDLNTQITAADGESYSEKLRGALGAAVSDKVRYGVADQLIELESRETSDDKVHALVIEFDKE